MPERRSHCRGDAIRIGCAVMTIYADIPSYYRGVFVQ